jgi:NADH-quinone oxidoreductase subunit E
MEDKVKEIITKYGNDKSFVIPILQDIQREFNYLPREALDALVRNLGVPQSLVYHLATFYRAFSLTPRGEHTCLICMGTACHVRGGPKILSEFERQLDVKAGETTKDNKFTLETVACLGCCAIGPVVVIDEAYYGHATIRKVGTILKKYQKGRES